MQERPSCKLKVGSTDNPLSLESSCSLATVMGATFVARVTVLHILGAISHGICVLGRSDESACLSR